MRNWMLILLAPVMFLGVGCVEREWTLRSDPPGAIAYVNQTEVGRTPVTLEFTWYGDYDVMFVKDGYETLKTHVKLNPPPYEWLGVDFFSEIAPWTYHDRRETLHVLEKAKVPTDADLIKNAEELRRQVVTEPYKPIAPPEEEKPKPVDDAPMKL